jgi:hypothetical protein
MTGETDRLEDLRLRLADTTRKLPFDIRIEEFYEALADILEMRSDFGADATLGEYISQDEFLHVASAYHLAFDADGCPQDALQS